MSAAHKLKWPTVFSGLKGATRVNVPNEISASISLAEVDAMGRRAYLTHRLLAIAPAHQSIQF